MNQPTYTEDYRGYGIEIWYDSGMPCPFDDWDCEPPIAVAYGRQKISEHATEYGFVSEAPSLTREQILANSKDLLDILDERSWFRVIDRTDLSYSDIVDIINEALADHLNSSNYSERLDMLATIWNASGVLAVCKSISGYSQGDYAEVLAVATPEFLQQSGAPNTVETLDRAINLYSDWAWGNVYGYTIEPLKDASDVPFDSCGGFYGDYDDKFGALIEAKDTIDRHIAYETRGVFKRFKDWARQFVWNTRRRFV